MKLGLSRTHQLALWWLAAGCAGLGCSLALKFEECRTDADCMTGGEPLVCNDEGECIPAPDPGTVPCATNADCVAAFDANHVCGPMGGCAVLLSQHCQTIVPPDGAAPDSIEWIASMLPTSGYYADTFGLLENAVQLAVEDFNDVTSLSGSKKVGWVACDTQGDKGIAGLIAEHLALTGISTIVGPALPDELLEIASTTTGAGMFVISPTASAAEISDLADNDLIWRTIPSDAAQANAIVDRLPLLDPPPDRIMILAKRGPYGQGLFDAVKPAADELFPGTVASLYYDDPGTTEDDFQAIIANTVAFAAEHHADTMLLLGDVDTSSMLLFYLSNAWEGSGDPLPRFVFSHGGVAFMEPSVETVDPGFIPTLAANVEGISPIIQDEQNFDSFDTRYGIRFSGEGQLPMTALAYDATIVALLGMAAAGDNPTGAAVADGMELLVDKSGTVVSFDTPALSFISDARDAVVDGTGVDLKGVSGELDFDLETGEVRTNLYSYGLVPAGEGNVNLTPLRLYTLDGASSSGTWSDL
jgi:branched-chain amino acid transport system substrate-binding protein